MVFSHDSRVSPVLESSCMSYTLRFCARCFLALARKSSFLQIRNHDHFQKHACTYYPGQFGNLCAGSGHPVRSGQQCQQIANFRLGQYGTGAAAGGLVGGLLGATSSKANSSGDKRRRSLFYGAGGALVGGLVGSATGGKKATVYSYSVDLLDGGSVSITTEQGHIDKGDCVSVERGQDQQHPQGCSGYLRRTRKGYRARAPERSPGMQ